MEPWVRISLILCMFGFLKALRPSEYYIVEYYLHPPMNFTAKQVAQEFFPCSIYSHMISLVLVFLVIDYLRYKPVIILHTISGMVVFTMLINVRKVFLVKIAESTYGMFLASEVAYYTYIYAKVGKEHYQEVTGHTRAAKLLGTASSGLIAQLLITNNIMTYYHLNFLNVGGLGLALVWAIFLPPVKESIYSGRRNQVTSVFTPSDFHSPGGELGCQKSVGAINGADNNQETAREENVPVRKLMLVDLRHAFTNAYLGKWILWSVLGTAGFFQVSAFDQLLIDDVAREDGVLKQQLWNGAISSACTVLGAASTFLTGKLNLRWNKIGDYVLAVNTIVMAVILYAMSHSDNLVVTYAGFIGVNIIHQSMTTIVNSEIAKNMKENCFGFIFGVLTFMSGIIQSLLTFILVENGFRLPPRKQFAVYSGYYLVIGGLYVLLSIFAIARTCRK